MSLERSAGDRTVKSLTCHAELLTFILRVKQGLFCLFIWWLRNILLVFLKQILSREQLDLFLKSRLGYIEEWIFAVLYLGGLLLVSLVPLLVHPILHTVARKIFFFFLLSFLYCSKVKHCIHPLLPVLYPNHLFLSLGSHFKEFPVYLFRFLYARTSSESFDPFFFFLTVRSFQISVENIHFPSFSFT